jgi:hypothetical protein
MGANLESGARKGIFFGAAAVVQLDGSVFKFGIWHMTDWLSTACCLYGARLNSGHQKPAASGQWPVVVVGCLLFGK